VTGFSTKTRQKSLPASLQKNCSQVILTMILSSESRAGPYGVLLI